MKSLVLLLLVVLMSVNGFAVTWGNAVNWSGTGDWMDQARWSDSTAAPDWSIPGWVVGNPLNTGGSTDPDWNDGYAIIENGTANLTPASNPDGTVRLLYVGSNSASATLNVSDDLTVRDKTYMGYNSADATVSTINQTAGNVTLTGQVLAGRGAGTSDYNLSGGTLATAHTQDIMGYDGSSAFVLNQTGGTFYDTGSELQFGRGATAPGTYNLSGGEANLNSLIYLGVFGRGEIIQTGGSLYASKMYVGGTTSANCSGFLKISGGDFTCGTELVVRNQDAKMLVSGSGATRITMKKFTVNASKTLAVELDGDGSTLIEVTGLDTGSVHGAFLDGSILEVDILAGFDGVAGDVYDILWSAAELSTTGLTLNNLSGVDFDLGVVNENNGQMLQLTVVPEPATIFLLSSGLLLASRRKRRAS